MADRPQINAGLPDAATLQRFLDESFRQAECVVIDAGPMYATVRKLVDERHLRPGGTVSGPTIMAAADCGLYVALLATIGIVPLAVTTSLTLNFLRKPEAGRHLIAQTKLLKVGSRLAVGEVSIFSEGVDDAIAHATATYSIPPRT